MVCHYWSQARVIVVRSSYWGWMAAATQWTLSTVSLAKPSMNQDQASWRNSWKQGPKVVKASHYLSRGRWKALKMCLWLFCIRKIQLKTRLAFLFNTPSPSNKRRLLNLSSSVFSTWVVPNPMGISGHNVTWKSYEKYLVSKSSQQQVWIFFSNEYTR